MRPGQRPHEPHGGLPSLAAPDAGPESTAHAGGQVAETRASHPPARGAIEPPGAGKATGMVVPAGLQFANTAVGDTALALSPSVIVSGRRDTQHPGREAKPAPPLAGEFGPYTIVRQVGAGGMGAVYEALDGRSGARVAIKSLLRMGASELHRFKYEFRSMAGVGHPNLVTLYELVTHAETWCITMEFVEGVDLCTALRRRWRSAVALRGLLRQLALAIEALHAHNLLHRDLKPSNVLVTANDRVVVLDFGLVAEISRSSFSQAQVHAGTPLYMAPEQCASQLATPASDWYALGVMLFEAVTGKLPFVGTAAQIFLAKQTGAPPVPALPNDPSLAALITALLRRDPAERASGAHVLAWCDGVSAPLLGPVPSASSPPGSQPGGGAGGTVELGGDVPMPRARLPSQVAPAAPSAPGVRRTPLVAREAERAVLEQAYAEAAGGRPTSVYLRGVSGSGKTALGQCFLADLAQAGEAMVLSGRCYEHESVPFKAFDAVLDALSEQLLAAPTEELGPLVGAYSAELVRVFPVFERIAAVREAAARQAARQAARAGSRSVGEGGEHDSRRRAFAALKRMLYALAVRRPLVLAIDDLHWSDVDSLHLLRELLAPPEVPPMLILAAYRSDWPGSPAALHELEQIQMRVVADQSAVRVELGPLAPADARALARALLASAGLASGRATEQWAATIAEESGGNAFLISAVVRHLSHAPGELEARRGAGGIEGLQALNSLNSLILARIARLDPGARALLELVAVAGQPVPADLLGLVQGRPAGLHGWLGALHKERLIFLGQRGRERSVECAHDRLREVVVAGLAPEQRALLHRRLAATAVASGRDDPEFLARHLHAAGDHAAAAEQAERAARAAAEALAFDRAAELYLLALQSARAVDGGLADAWRLMAACADAKVNAGRGSEAVALYFEASEAAPADQTFGLRQKACEQHFAVGETDRAVVVLRGLLVDLGLEYPDSSEDVHRSFVAIVGALARDEPGPTLATEASRAAVDTLWSASKGFLIHSPIRGAYFAAASAWMARLLGREADVVRGLIALQAVVSREQDRALFDALDDRVQRYMAAQDDAYVVGFAAIMGGVAASVAGQWGEAMQGIEFGTQHLRSRCAGVSWECNFGLLMLMSLLETRGELRSIAHRSAVMAQQAKETGNSMIEFVAAYYRSLTLIAGDATAQARAHVRQAARVGLNEELPAAHLRALMIEVRCDLYAGDVAAAWSRVEAAWSYYEKWQLLSARSQRINASGLRGQVALARARMCSGEERAMLLGVADHERKILEAAATPQARAMAALLRAMAAAASGRTAAAVVHRLHTAVAAFEAADMALHAACVSHRLGEWSGGEAGAELIARCEAFMQLQTIARPQRYVAMLTPALAPQMGRPEALV